MDPKRHDPADVLRRLARLGKRMRELQGQYFKTRNPMTLVECKDAERRFDEAVRWVLTPPGQRQQTIPGMES